MSPDVRGRFDSDMTRSRDAARSGDAAAAWELLEDAHVLSQPWVGPHLRTHASMLVLATRTGDLREGLGQILRLMVAAPGSITGRYPVGNTGRARVSMFAPMPVTPELAELIEAS